MGKLLEIKAIEKLAPTLRISELQGRIAEIQKKFASGDFQATLEREMARNAQKFQSVGAEAVKVLDNQPLNENISAKIQNLASAPQVATNAPEIANTFPFPDEDDGTIDLPTRTDKRFVENFPRENTERLIESAARKNGVDSALVRAIATAESNLDQNAISGVGAIGVMQLMPSTAASLGVNPYDERENIEGGARYIRQMLDQFNGNLPQAIAAYNAGPGAVQRYGGIPPFAETQNYVGRVMDIYIG